MNSSAFSLPSESQRLLWLNLLRVVQVMVICLTIGLFIASIPLNYEQRSTICRAEICPPGQLTTASEMALNAIGMSVDTLVKITIALDILVAVIFTISAMVIFVRKPGDALSLFVTMMLVTFGMATFTAGIQGISQANPSLRWLTNTVAMIGNLGIIAFLFIFPSGRFVPRWTVLILVAWIVFQLPRYYSPDSYLDIANTSPLLYNLLFTIGVLSGVVNQIYRYRRVSDPVERQQTKWVVYGLGIGVGGYIVLRLLGVFIPDPNGSGLAVSLTLLVLSDLFMLLLPISIAVAVVRYRLWDINPIINRTIVYGLLSACTITLYILAVGIASRYFQEANFVVAFVATGVVAILFEPLRGRLQRAVNRLMYGERDDPATVLTRLSQRLDSALAPDSVLQTIVETISQTLRLPYAAISLLSADGSPRLIASVGSQPLELVYLPLTYQAERLGELILAPRAAGESFSTADLNLLHIISGQAGIAVNNLRLTQDLQRSRERLVTAREEERRRLRRDLHDGVGPTLASLTQRLDTAADLVNTDPQETVELIKELKGQVKGSVAEIRRLVYALRPPVLDEFGLVSALREHVAPYTGPNGLQITFDVTDPMPPLPAAVEVAVYRIALEAFTNITNHAEATACHFVIRLEDNSLLLDVSDNGKGLSSHHHAGVGLASMRERAAELSGKCSIEDISTGGTRVKARLPIAKD
jgi:signal transduction histidine kinase